MSFKKKIFKSKKFTKFLYHLVRTYSSSFRLRIENEKKWMDHIDSGGKIILCSWHQQFFPYIRYFKNYNKFNPCIMISQSKDGDVVADLAKYTGWYPARGSSSKGGRGALMEIIDRINNNSLAIHLIDGPTGPPGIVKNGAIKMAVETGAAIVPAYIETENDWHVSSWDRFIIPKPFSRVKIIYKDPIFFEKTDDINTLETYRQQLESCLKPELKYF